MPLYAYKARNPHGTEYTGYRFAANPDEIFKALKAEGLLLTGCRESSAKSLLPGYAQDRASRFSKGLPKALLIDFCHHMAQLDHAGVPLPTAIEDLALSTPHRKFRTILHLVHEDLQMGIPLSEALSRHPHAFDRVFQTLIHTAEQAGSYAPQFRHLEAHLRRQDHIRHQLRKSLRTPAILLGLLAALIAIMVELVIPNMVELLTSLGLKELPLSTRLLLPVATFFAYAPLLPVLGGAFFALGFVFPALRYQFSRLALHLPYHKALALDHFWHVFAVMTEAGIELMPSLTQATQIVSNPCLREQLASVTGKISEGASLSEAFERSGQNKLLVSPFMMRLLKLSEQTGQLRALIPQAAAQHHNQTHRQVETSMAWLEPVLILVMGGFMLWIVLAVMVPFYSILGEGS